MGEFTDRLTRWGFLLITVLALGVWITLTAEEATGASISEGQTLFGTSCEGCHSGGRILQGKTMSVDQIVATLNPGGSMQSYASGFTADQKLSVACYVKSAFMGGIPTGETRCPARPATTSTTSSTTTTAPPSTTSSTTTTAPPSTTSSTTTTAPPSTTSSTTTTTPPPSSPSTGGAGTAYAAGPAGTVYLGVEEGRLVLVSVDSAWTWKVKEDDGEEVEIFFMSPGTFVRFEAEYEDGMVETEVDVRGRRSGHDNDDERRGSHDDDDEHEGDDHHDGEDHDDD